MGLQRILLGAMARVLRAWKPLVWGVLAVALTSQTLAEPKDAASAAKVERHALDLLDRRDDAAAAHELAVAAQAGRPVAQYRLADQLMHGAGVVVDRVEAFKWYSAAAQQGVAGAQSALGWMYLYGQGSKQDTGEAVRWLAAAARQDEPAALRLLSILYSNGIGVPSDHALADQLMHRAMELNDPEACLRLGLRSLYGGGAQRDAPYGLQLLRKAADMQDSNAAYALGWWYLSSQPNAPELHTAVHWLTTSADAQHAMAGLWLSHIYDIGLGVPLNSAKARELLEHALALANLQEKNDFAWELSVNPDRVLRDGPLAVRIMQTELAAAKARTPAYLDTLAAAYAEAGDFARAAKAQQNALAALRPAQRATEREMHDRLQIYRAGRPFREARP